MTKGDILARYKSLSPEDRRCFERWLRANAVVGFVFGFAFVIMPLEAVSIQELHALAHLDNLPVEQIHNQTLVFTAPEAETRSAIVTEPLREIAD